MIAEKRAKAGRPRKEPTKLVRIPVRAAKVARKIIDFVLGVVDQGGNAIIQMSVGGAKTIDLPTPNITLTTDTDGRIVAYDVYGKEWTADGARGKITITASGEYSITPGRNSHTLEYFDANGYNARATGVGVESSARYVVVSGHENYAVGPNQTATPPIGQYATGITDGSLGNGQYATGIGPESKVSGSYATGVVRNYSSSVGEDTIGSATGRFVQGGEK